MVTPRYGLAAPDRVHVPGAGAGAAAGRTAALEESEAGSGLGPGLFWALLQETSDRTTVSPMIEKKKDEWGMFVRNGPIPHAANPRGEHPARLTALIILPFAVFR